jgi:hypothetical protein
LAWFPICDTSIYTNNKPKSYLLGRKKSFETEV